MIHKKSLIESLCNVGSGFIISLLIWEYVISYFFNIKRCLTDGVKVTIIFTVISIVRGYIWRRLFSRMETK